MIFLGFLLVGCAQGAKQPTEGVTRSGLEQKNFQSEVDGKPVGLYVLENKNKMEVCITNYGGRIVSIVFPDKEGKLRDVVLGFDNIKSYIDTDNNFGATIGRYGNRIAHGRFHLMGWCTNCLSIILVIAYTEATRVFIPECLMRSSLMAKRWCSLTPPPMVRRGSLVGFK